MKPIESIRALVQRAFKKRSLKVDTPVSEKIPETKRVQERKENEEHLGNPYLNARRTWNRYTGEIIQSRTIWQFIALSSVLLALAAIGGLYYIGSQSKIIPYVIAVDKLGEAAAIGPALKGGSLEEPAVVRAQVKSFIENARLVTSDIALQRKAVFHVYAMLTDSSPAHKKINQWYGGTPESSPLIRAQHELVRIEITSILPLTQHTWQVDWIEHVEDRTGEEKKRYRMRATVTVQFISEGRDEKQTNENPSGIYIRDFYWAEQA